jgi:hypothetical protein
MFNNFWNSKFIAIVQSNFIKPFNKFISVFTNWFKPKQVAKEIEMSPVPVKEKVIEILDRPVSINVAIPFMNRRLGYFFLKRADQIRKDKEVGDASKISQTPVSPSNIRTFGR